MKRLNALLALTIAIVFVLAGCEADLTGPDDTVVTQGEAITAGQSPANCENVKGTGSIAGSVIPDEEGNVTASGPVEGDIEGTITIVRDEEPERQGNGTTFTFYKEVTLETNDLGTFEGTADGNFNMGLDVEGQRSNRAMVHIDFGEEGFMKLNGPFDFSELEDGIIKADFKYNGRLCKDG